MWVGVTYGFFFRKRKKVFSLRITCHIFAYTFISILKGCDSHFCYTLGQFYRTRKGRIYIIEGRIRFLFFFGDNKDSRLEKKNDPSLE